MSTTVDEAGTRRTATLPPPERRPSQRQGPLAIPPLIRRNTILLALTQAFVGMGNQTTPTLAPIIVVQMLGSAALLRPRHQHPRRQPTADRLLRLAGSRIATDGRPA